MTFATQGVVAANCPQKDQCRFANQQWHSQWNTKQELVDLFLRILSHVSLKHLSPAALGPYGLQQKFRMYGGPDSRFFQCDFFCSFGFTVKYGGSFLPRGYQMKNCSRFFSVIFFLCF